jgi:L-fuconolactonase
VLIADSQVHIWAAPSEDRPWIEGGEAYAHRPVPFGPEELLAEMNGAGVARAVLIPPTWEGLRNDLALDASGSEPDRLKVMARVRFDAADAREQVRNLAADPRVAGIRAVFVRATANQLDDGTADWFWPLAEQLEIPVMFCAPGNWTAVRQIATRYPDVRLALCHLNLGTGVRDESINPGVSELVRLAGLDNVAVKTSCLPNYSTAAYPFRNIHDAVRRVIDAYGPERCFWGSDLSRLRCTYLESVTMMTDGLSDLGPSALGQIMGASLCEWLGWANVESATADPTERQATGYA